MVIAKYFVWFVFYSFVGWVYESILCSVEEKHLINRGFLNGPVCPIYGTGAILVILLLGRIENSGLLFVLGVLVTGVLEYATSYAMEKLFHAKWWDYSERRFNIGGRICLIGMIVFGLMSVIIIKLVHPMVVYATAKIPQVILAVIAAVTFLMMAFDTTYTVIRIKGFDKKLSSLHAKLQENLRASLEEAHPLAAIEKAKREFKEIDLKLRLDEAAAAFKERMNYQEKRMLTAFPKWKSVNHNDIVERIKNSLR